MSRKIYLPVLGIWEDVDDVTLLQDVPRVSSDGALIDPATGEIILMGNGGAAVIDISDTDVVVLSLGQNTNTTLAPGIYQVMSDVDCYVLDSAAGGILGFASAAAGYYSTASGSLAAQTGLSFGTSDFTIELWVQVTDVVPTNNVRPFAAGATSNHQLVVYLNPKATTGVLQVGMSMTGASGTTIKSNTFIDTAISKSTDLHHYVITVDRASGGGTATVIYYLDTVVVGTQTFTEAGTPVAIDIAGVTSSGRITVGSTVGGGTNYQMNGRVEDVKFYIGSAFDSDRITARHDRGPERALGLPGDELLTWWMSFSNSASWANPLNPECVSGYGNAVMTPTGDAAITARSGGSFASADTSPLILAHQPQLISVTHGNINITPLGLGSGGIRFSPVVS